MDVIRKLGDRVQKEHNQFLRDSQRIEDRSSTADNGLTGASKLGGNVDFESLVSRANGATVKADTVIENWGDDVWGSIFTNGPEVSEVADNILLVYPM
jgi:SCY1-like protein 2